MMFELSSIYPTTDVMILLAVCLWMLFRGRGRSDYP